MEKHIKELRRQAREMTVGVTVGKSGLTDNIIRQIRTLLARNPLLKVRLPAENRKGLAESAARLAAAVPCRLIDTIGFTAVLHAPESEPA